MGIEFLKATMIKKGAKDGTKAAAVSTTAIVTVAKILDIDLSIEQAGGIGIAIGAISGGTRCLFNWLKHGLKVF